MTTAVQVMVVSQDLEALMAISNALYRLSPSTSTGLDTSLKEITGTPTILVTGPIETARLLDDDTLRRSGLTAVAVMASPTMAELRKALQVGFRDVVDVAHLQSLAGSVQKLVHRESARHADDDLPDGPRGRVVVVTSAKAGQGSTTVAANLATRFAQTGSAVLMEGDPRFGDLLNAFGYRQHRTRLVPAGLGLGAGVDQALFRHPSGLLLVLPPQDADVMLEADDAMAALSVLQTAADVVVLDVPFWVLETHRLHRVADQVIVVSSDRARDLTRVPLLAESLALAPSVTGLVVSDTGEKHRMPDQRIEAATGLHLLGAVPVDREVEQALEVGEPVLLHAPRSHAARALRDLADAVQAQWSDAGEELAVAD